MGQASYIPSRLANLVTWATNFNTLITASPTTYGLLASDAVTINGYVTPWLAAYTAAADPSTRTKTTVQARVDAQAAMLVIVRQYAQQIQKNAGVSNDSKTALGLNIPITTRTPIPVPETQPLVAILAATPGQFTCRFNDPNRPNTSRAKPFGARMVQVAVAYAVTPVTNPDLATLVFDVTTQPFVVNHDFTQNGKVATVFARWTGRAVQVPGSVGYGPWSLPASMTVSF